MSSNRSRGRPSLDPSGAPSVPVHLKLVQSDFQRVEQIAKAQRDKSAQDVIRAAVKRLLTDERGGSI